MTNSEAIETLRANYTDACYEQLREAVDKAIMKLMYPAQQWIPLSTNQLPEEHQKVLIQFKEGRHCPHFKVQVGYIGVHDVEDNNFRKIGVKKVWYTNQYYYDLDMVVAWMPFELYKESENVSITNQFDTKGC